MSHDNCPRCGIRYTLDYNSIHRKTVDHIIPKEWGARSWITEGVSNKTPMCAQCNSQRAIAGHCWGAHACVKAVAEDRGRLWYNMANLWGMRYVTDTIQRPRYTPWFPPQEQPKPATLKLAHKKAKVARRAANKAAKFKLPKSTFAELWPRSMWPNQPTAAAIEESQLLSDLNKSSDK